VNEIELLDRLVETLENIEVFLPEDKAAWDNDARIRLAVERQWITAGNLAETYRSAAGVGVGVEPWAELYRLRNLIAHALPGDLSPDRVWAETKADLPRLLDEVRGRRA
jgi:uncharacterized protein with HEPN domain